MSAPTAPGALDDALRGHVEAALRASGGDVRRTAAALGISRNTLRARMDKYGLRQHEAGLRAPSADPAAPGRVGPDRVGATPRTSYPRARTHVAAQLGHGRPTTTLAHCAH